MWHYSDAVAAGDTGEALRRLADFLTHGHPLQLLAFLLADLRRRSLAATAPEIETLAEWLGSSPDHYPVRKAWNQREVSSDDELRRALDALSRADIELKTAPESSHRVTMERLTVALTRWYGGGRRRRRR
jgi:DNA polymerase III delta subunit